MRRFCVLLLAIVTLAVMTTPALAGVLHDGLANYLADRPDSEYCKVIVSLTDRADIDSLNFQLKREGATLAQRHQHVVEALQTVAQATQPRLTDYLQKRVMRGDVRDFRTFWIDNMVGVEATVAEIKRIAARPEVEMVYLDYVIELIAPVEQDKVGPVAPRKEGSERDRAIEPGISAIKAPEAWALGYSGLGRVIANMDTGVDGNHEALASRWRGLTEPAAECWFDPVTSTTFPFDSGSHGTHTMGTIAGYTADNEIGVAKDATWISAGVIDRVDIETTMTDAVAAFQWFADPDGNPGTTDDVPDAVGNSWGISPIYHGSYITGPCDETFWDVMDNCEAAGCAVIFSAGNEGPTTASLRTPGDRADSPYNAFAVGSVDATNYTFPYPISSFSSLGPGCNDQIKPEVVAPGTDVRSSVPGNSYSSFSGTSMASPHVTGSVAVLRQVDPNLDVDTIKDILLTTAVDLGPVGEENTFGMGIIDLEQAVIYASQGFGTVQGTVTDSGSGAPIPAQVEELSSGRIVFANEVTGAYSMSAAGDQSYTFEATYFGYLPEQQTAYVPVDGTVTVDFTLDPAPAGILEGTVSDLEGTPIEGAVISVAGTPLAPETTNASGFYQFTTIPGGSTYTIQVAAIGFGDDSADVFVPVGDTVVQDFSLTPAEAFEISDGNFIGGGEWEWGTATVGPTAAHSGVKLWGTDLDGSYDNSALYTLDSREYSLNEPGALGFYHWRNIESGYDGGNVKISTDGGGTWELLLPDGGYPDDSITGLGEPGFTGSGEWELVTFDLSTYLGQTVIFRWTFGTDGSVAYDGWYIDDVIVWGASSELLLPDMELSAGEIHLYADPGGTDSETLTFTNNGDGYLNFSISAAIDYGTVNGTGGPDTYGYSWRDSDEAGGPAYNWIDITGIGTQITGLGDDTNAGPFDIGFGFNFYGTTFSQFNFCTNGWLSFTSTATSYSNSTIPSSSAPANMIAPFWDDQNFNDGGTAYYYSDGSQLIVSWIDVAHYSSGGPYTYQVILNSDGTMVYQYNTMTAPLDSCTIGIQNSDGSDGLQVVYNAAYMHDSLAVEFGTGWLSTDPTGGQVPAMGSLPVSVSGDASDLDAGDYAGSLTVNSNDPVTPTVVIPVTFHVGAGAGTVDATFDCQPSSGVVPFASQFTVTMTNLTTENRRAAGNIDLVIASGTSYKNWRAGWTNLSPGEVFSNAWNQNFPALGSLIGDNVFSLLVADVTPAPYNQPPYSPDGDTATAACTVTGLAP